jgi:hypothetical protein
MTASFNQEKFLTCGKIKKSKVVKLVEPLILYTLTCYRRPERGDFDFHSGYFYCFYLIVEKLQMLKY